MSRIMRPVEREAYEISGHIGLAMLAPKEKPVKLNPVVLVTIDGGIADVMSSKGVQVVLVDFDLAKSSDIDPADREALIRELNKLLSRKDLEQEFRAEIKDAIDTLEDHG